MGIGNRATQLIQVCTHSLICQTRLKCLLDRGVLSLYGMGSCGVKILRPAVHCQGVRLG